MSDARDAVLGAIRKSLGRDRLPPGAARALETRVPAHPRPQLAGDPVDRFIARAGAQSISLEHAATRDAIPNAVAAYLQRHKLPARLVIARPLAALGWPASFAVEVREARQDDAVSVTPCFAAIAETGSIVLLSSPASPTTLAFVPDDHIVVLSREQIVAQIEDVWRRLRTAGLPMPRALNIVSGPSRTADIEQVVQLGVHGPRRLHLIVVDEPLS